MSARPGDLNWSTQHFILNGKDGVSDAKSRMSSRFHCGREDRIVGSLAARGVADSDWPSVWQGIIVDLLSVGTAWRNPSCATASLAVGIDAVGTRGDIQGHSGASIGAIDGPVAGPLAL